MKKLIPVLLLLTVSVFAQGKLFAPADIDVLYGPALHKVKVPVEILKQWCDQVDHYIGFAMPVQFSKYNVDVDGTSINDVVVYGPAFKVLSANKSVELKQDAIAIYSKYVIAELLQVGSRHVLPEIASVSSSVKTDYVVFELHKDGIISVNYGDTTMEFQANCPPWCL